MELLDGLSNRTRRDPPTRRWHSPLIFVVFNLWASVGFGRARTAGSCAQICNKILAAICHLSSDGNPGIDAVSLVDGSDSLIALCFRYVRLGRVGQPVLLLLIVDPSCNTKGLGRRHHASHVLFECHAGGTLWECGVCPASLRILALHRPLGVDPRWRATAGVQLRRLVFPRAEVFQQLYPNESARLFDRVEIFMRIGGTHRPQHAASTVSVVLCWQPCETRYLRKSFGWRSVAVGASAAPAVVAACSLSEHGAFCQCWYCEATVRAALARGALLGLWR